MARLPRSKDELPGLRAARWFRESTAGQFDNFGPDAQRDQQDRAIDRHGLVDTGRSWQVAASGWKDAWRTPEFAAMVAAAKAGQFDVLVVGYNSRFLRNLKQTLIAVEDSLHPAGVAVLFADERVLTSDPDDWSAFAREAQEAEAYSRKHSKRVAEGYAAKRKRQGIPGGNRPPFGYLRTENSRALAIDPGRMPVVQRVFQLAAAGYTDRQIGDAVGLKQAHVGEIVTNPVYRGVLRTGEAFALAGVVDSAIWHAAQNQRAKATRRQPGRGTLRIYPLARLLHCASCREPLFADTERFRHRQPVCEEFKAAKPETVAYGGESYKAELYDGIIPAVLAHVAEGSALLPAVLEELDESAGTDKARLARIAHEREAAGRRLTSDRDVAQWQATMARLDREEEEARTAQAVLPTAEEARAYLTDLPRLYEACGPAERKALANAMFDRIDVLGFEEVTLHLTEEAKRYGWLSAWHAEPLTVPLGKLGYGRGERSQPSGTDLFVPMTWPLPVHLVGLRRAVDVVR